jgi:hypothetical protein
MLGAESVPEVRLPRPRLGHKSQRRRQANSGAPSPIRGHWPNGIALGNITHRTRVGMLNL